MGKGDICLKAGRCLRVLIKQNYKTQEEFALDFHVELRTVNRWINKGVDSITTIQRIAERFNLDFLEFFQLAP